MTMTKNVGDRDRTIRLIAGVLLIFWGINAANGMAFIGIYLLATVYFRTDPVYGFLGMNTHSSSGSSTTGSSTEVTTDSEREKAQVEQQRPIEERTEERVE
jgi:hypothetical protein